jgi:hypothetical protein
MRTIMKITCSGERQLYYLSGGTRQGNLIRPHFFFLARLSTAGFFVIVTQRNSDLSTPLTVATATISLLGFLNIINAFHVQRDDEDYDAFTQRIDSRSSKVDAAYGALHLAGYNIAANYRGNHRRKCKLTPVDPANALANNHVSNDDDPIVICLTASSGKENNKEEEQDDQDGSPEER